MNKSINECFDIYCRFNKIVLKAENKFRIFPSSINKDNVLKLYDKRTAMAEEILFRIVRSKGEKTIIEYKGNKFKVNSRYKDIFMKVLVSADKELNFDKVMSRSLISKTGAKGRKKSSKIKYYVAVASLVFGTLFSTSKLNEKEVAPTISIEIDNDDVVSSSYNDEIADLSIDSTSAVVASDTNDDVVSSTLYYNIEAPKEWQDFIFSKASEYGIPANIAFTIVERESGGHWNTNGVISSTSDYGVSQINEVNLSFINKNLGYSKEEILYDPYKNIDSMFFLLSYIFNTLGYDENNFNYENVFGTYNGWLNWRQYKNSVNYAKGCLDIMNETICDSNMTLNLSK